MWESIMKIFKKIKKNEAQPANSKDAAKERLHLVLMQDRANVSADFLELMKQEIIEVIKKYIEVDEESIDVRLTNKENDDGTKGAPALYANIPIVNVKDEVRKKSKTNTDKIKVQASVEEKIKEEDQEVKQKDKAENDSSTMQNANNNKKEQNSNNKKAELNNNPIKIKN